MAGEYVELRILAKNDPTAQAVIAAIRTAGDGYRIHVGSGQRGPYPFRDGRVAYYLPVTVDLAVAPGPPHPPTATRSEGDPT
jgi:hypothetical protein